MSEPGVQLEFVVGAEKRIADIVSRAEIEPLLRSLVKAGPRYAAVLSDEGQTLCRGGAPDPLDQACLTRLPLLVEGEPKGVLAVEKPAPDNDDFTPLALLARDAVQLIITNNLKRMLTTEMHTAIVQESYEQLMETNRQLSESEKRYRDLALSLEQKVEERTTELQKAYVRMLQQEKLAAVGGLAAGMAHEINTPIGFIRSNLTTLGRYLERMRTMLNQYQLLIAANTPLSQLSDQTEQRRRELKIDFVMSDGIELVTQSLAGSERIARIVADLKGFSHVDESGPSDADLNLELEQTLSVLASHIPANAQIVRDLQPLPRCPCNPALLSQAFQAVILNALQSDGAGLVVRVASRAETDHIVITVIDNGQGMSEEVLRRAFEPFYTTRDVGSGTGMGLTVAREIMNASGGSIELESAPGHGTTVTLTLPLRSIA